MNQKTMKMLSRYSSKAGKPLKETKQGWLALNWKQKTAERKKILAELANT